MDYVFIGNAPRLYQFFEAQPGDTRAFASVADVPTDGLWLPVDQQEINSLEAQGFTVTPPGE